MEKKVKFPRGGNIAMLATVTIDCQRRTITLSAAGETLTTRIRGSFDAVTHYGYGAANADNLFTAIEVK